MQRLVLKMTIAIAGLIGPIVQASELEKNELDEVVTFATNLGSGLITRIGQWPRERLQT